MLIQIGLFRKDVVSYKLISITEGIFYKNTQCHITQGHKLIHTQTHVSTGGFAALLHLSFKIVA